MPRLCRVERGCVPSSLTPGSCRHPWCYSPPGTRDGGLAPTWLRTLERVLSPCVPDLPPTGRGQAASQGAGREGRGHLWEQQTWA